MCQIKKVFWKYYNQLKFVTQILKNLSFILSVRQSNNLDEYKVAVKTLFEINTA